MLVDDTKVIFYNNIDKQIKIFDQEARTLRGREVAPTFLVFPDPSETLPLRVFSCTGFF
jgi:hypothetical protein